MSSRTVPRVTIGRHPRINRAEFVTPIWPVPSCAAKRGRSSRPCRSHPTTSSSNPSHLSESTLIFFFFTLVARWVCHVDDDMYVLMDVLMERLSKLDPREDHAYVGRPNTPWHSQQGLQVKDGATIAKPGVPFDFALGGLYCLSRSMLVSIAPYLGYTSRIEGVWS